MSIRHRVTTAALAAILLLGFVAAPSQAAAPAAPVLVGPANGSTAATADIPLSVTATDPDGDELDVRFEGRRVGATVPGGTAGEPFTIVAVPDTQNYTYSNRQGTMTQQTQWIVSTRSTLKTAMVIQLGDLVSNFDNLTQWGYTSTAFGILDDAAVPNTVVGGNHDFNTSTGAFTEYDSFFPPSRYANATWTPSSATYGGYLGQNLFGADPVDRRNMNNFALFSAGGRDFLVLNLEWETPQVTLDWAAKVLAAYPDRIAILATHSFVQINGLRNTVPQRSGGIPAETVWNNFVSQQCSIRLVLNGHYHAGDLGEANRSDLNRCGQPVQQILTDYQDRANGGDGWLRYYSFDPAANTMTATTYSPKLNQYETDADSAFTLPFDLSAPQPAPFTTIATVHTTSGGTAATTWSGLLPDTLYEWRAVAIDGTTSTTSPTWTVRTPATPPTPLLVDDTFTRNVSNGWGAADPGHAWQTSGAATSFSVDGAAGRITTPAGGGRGASLTGVTATDVRITADVALTQAATGSGAYVSLLGRAASTRSYRAKLRYLATGGLTLALVRYTGAETTLATATLTGVTVTAGQSVRVKLELEGTAPTTLRAKAWKVGTTEPSAWTLTRTDSTAALQVAGTAAVDTYTSGTATAPATASFDRFSVSGLGGTPPANVVPQAVIGTPTINNLVVGLSGSGSTDSDGTITGYAWNFGDSSTGSGVTTSHTYATSGTYIVTLTVTDNNGATDSTTRQVTVTPPGNVAPQAAIGTPTISNLTVGLSGSGSTDSDGTITGYAWNFGDSTTGTGVSTSHTYTAAGTYTVTLTVTDNNGATGNATRQVTVTAPAGGPLAQDAFSRTTTGGWGSATTGGAWSSAGATSRYAVANGTGRHILAAAGNTADSALTGVSATAVDLRGTLAWSRTGAAGTLYAYVLPRRVNASNDYRCKVVVSTANTVRLDLVRRVGGAETALTSSSIAGALTANQAYAFACRVVPSGTGTQVTGKFWRVGTTEPSGWQATATDTTAALQGAGSVGISSYVSSGATAGVTMSVDDLIATNPGA